MAKGKTQKSDDKSPGSRATKAKYQKKYNATTEEKKKRVELQKKRRAAIKKGQETSKTDYDHAVGKRVPKKVNRGRKSGTKGDRSARGKKK